MEAVDGADVGEDPLHHIWREGGARSRLLQELGTKYLEEERRVREKRRGGDEERRGERFLVN